jgi:muramoyltetrapeptide carboxypeptidase LdcA involved in peptidoglycan recycling
VPGPSRRTLFSAGAASAAAPIAAGSSQAYAQSPVEPAPRAGTTPSPAIKPPVLKAGDRVRVVSPASKPTESLVARGTQIDQNQRLRDFAGVAVGQFIGSTGNPGDWTIVDLLRDKLGDLGIPVLGGLLIGHGTGQLSAPLGSRATVDTQAGTLTIEPGVR